MGTARGTRRMTKMKVRCSGWCRGDAGPGPRESDPQAIRKNTKRVLEKILLELSPKIDKNPKSNENPPSHFPLHPLPEAPPPAPPSPLRIPPKPTPRSVTLSSTPRRQSTTRRLFANSRTRKTPCIKKPSCASGA